MALLKKGKEEKRFKYRARSVEAVQARADRRTGGGDSPVRDDIKLFRAKEGDHEIRILPPTWDNPEHYGYDVWVHYGIGTDESQYLCLNKMKGEPCPCCEERTKAKNEGEDDLATALAPKNRVAIFLIDRKAQRDGPKLWLQPASNDKEIAAQAIDKKRHSVINLDDPDEGYDISFNVEGTGKKTRYKAFKPDRAPSPLSDDEDQAAAWLEYVQENPIPDCLVFKSYDELATALEGGVRTVEDTDKKGGEEEERPRKRSRGDNGDDEKLREVEGRKGRPRIGSKQKEEEEEDVEEKPRKLGKKRLEPETDLTWEEVHALSEKQLEKLIEEHDIDPEDFEDANDLEEIADAVCARLGIREEQEEENERTRRVVKSGGTSKRREADEEEVNEDEESWQDKLKRLRAKQQKK